MRGKEQPSQKGGTSTQHHHLGHVVYFSLAAMLLTAYSIRAVVTFSYEVSSLITDFRQLVHSKSASAC